MEHGLKLRGGFNFYCHWPLKWFVKQWEENFHVSRTVLPQIFVFSPLTQLLVYFFVLQTPGIASQFETFLHKSFHFVSGCWVSASFYPIHFRPSNFAPHKSHVRPTIWLTRNKSIQTYHKQIYLGNIQSEPSLQSKGYKLAWFEFA